MLKYKIIVKKFIFYLTFTINTLFIYKRAVHFIAAIKIKSKKNILKIWIIKETDSHWMQWI